MKNGRIVTILLAFAVIGIGAYAVSSRVRWDRKPRRQVVSQPGPNSPSLRVRGAGPGTLSVSAAGPSGTTVAAESRFLCSQADQSGLYTVSFRGVRSDLGEDQRLPPGFAPPGALGTFTLYLQVTAADELLPLRRLDARSLRLVDNTGYEIRPADGVDRLPDPIAFPGGNVYGIKMRAPDPQATSLRSIQGVLRGFGLDEAQPPLPFKIASIPLPNAPRLFGRASAIEISEVNRGSSLKVLTGNSVDEALGRAKPASLPEAFTPQRMLLGPGLATQLRVPTPANGRPIQIQADIGPIGVIEVEVRQDSDQWRGKIWDGETFLVAPRGSREALAIRLTREANPVPMQVDSVSMFPPVDGSPAGMIISSVQVAGKPFGRGMMRVTLSHNEAGVWSAPRTSLIAVRNDGSVILPNLAEGEYRIERPGNSLTPYLPGIEQASVDTYIRYRFGAVNGKWSNEKVESIHVHSGQATQVPPLQWRPSK